MKQGLSAVFLSVVLLAGVASLATGALASQIDLNTFGPEGVVDIVADGSSATLGLDEHGYSVLQNDPAYATTDTGISIGTDTARLSFSYGFNEDGDSDTTFSWWLTDADGASLPTFYDDISESASGLVTLDLSDYIGQTLGMTFQLYEFALDANDNYLTGSNVTISDLQLTPVPIPGASILFCSGMAALFGMRKRMALG
jgi:hypothetical protein